MTVYYCYAQLAVSSLDTRPSGVAEPDYWTWTWTPTRATSELLTRVQDRFSMIVVQSVDSHGQMARLSWPGWLVTLRYAYPDYGVLMANTLSCMFEHLAFVAAAMLLCSCEPSEKYWQSFFRSFIRHDNSFIRDIFTLSGAAASVRSSLCRSGRWIYNLNFTVVLCRLEKHGIRRRNNIIIHRYSKYCDTDIFHHSASQTQLLDVDGKEFHIYGLSSA